MTMKYAIVHSACEKCQGQENSCQALFVSEEEPYSGWYWTTSYKNASLFWSIEEVRDIVKRFALKTEWIQEVPDEKAWRAQNKLEKCS